MIKEFNPNIGSYIKLQSSYFILNKLNICKLMFNLFNISYIISMQVLVKKCINYLSVWYSLKI